MIPSAEPSPLIRSYHVLMAMVFAVALGAGWMMLPGDNELIAMLERDGHARAALGILEQGYANGDRRYRTLHQMLALYEEQGDTRKARTILEEMVNARPYDPALRERLVNFYQAVGDQRARVVALKAQIETRYKEAACRQYVALLRLKGDSAEEIAGLQFCRQRGYRRSDDLARLAELLAASGDSVQASTILRAIDDVKRLTSSDDRFLFMDLLLQQGQPNEAVRRSVRWIKATKDQRLAVAVVDILARSNYPDSALDVAKSAGEQAIAYRSPWRNGYSKSRNPNRPRSICAVGSTGQRSATRTRQAVSWRPLSRRAIRAPRCLARASSDWPNLTRKWRRHSCAGSIKRP